MAGESESETSGYLVRDVMARHPITVDPERTVTEVAIVMDRSGCGCLLVTSGKNVLGIVTERDLVTKVLAKRGRISRMKVKAIMSTPLVVVNPNASVEEAATVMADNRVRRLPVVGQEGLVGLVTVTDIANALVEQARYHEAILKALAKASAPPETLYG